VSAQENGILRFSKREMRRDVFRSKCCSFQQKMHLTTSKKLSQIDFVLVCFQTSLSPSAPNTVRIVFHITIVVISERKTKVTNDHSFCKRELRVCLNLFPVFKLVCFSRSPSFLEIAVINQRKIHKSN